MCGHDHLLSPPPTPRNGRRRSADIGGLSLATRNGGLHGQGWLGHSEQLQTRYAELLSDMYTQTLNAVNNHTEDCSQPRLAAESRAGLIAKLDGWNFEPQSLPSEDHVAECAVLIFEALFRIKGLQEAVGVSLDQISPFIQHLRHIYRWQNSYHNFEHAVDVLQATYHYLCAAGVVPPVSILAKDSHATPTKPKAWQSRRPFDSGPLVTVLDPTDLFVLMVAAIGHDAGHPGFTNLFMQNAAAPLSAVYDGKSALEQMHVALLIRVMRAHGMAGILDGSDDNTSDRNRGRRARKLLFDTVLATDMRVHAAFMERFSNIVAGQGDLSLDNRRTTLCQALIKCADISNPSRPYYISQHWAVALQREWNAQAALEAHHALPRTVESSSHPMQAASSQMFFIPTFVKPLLDLVVQALAEMHPYVAQCDLNLALWKARTAILKASEARETISEAKVVSTSQVQMPKSPSARTTPLELTTRVPMYSRQPDDYNTVFPLTLPPAHARTPPVRGSLDTQFSWSRASTASPIPPPSSSSRAPSTTSTSPSEEDLESEASFVFSPTSQGTSTTSASPAPGGSDDDSQSDSTVVPPLDDGTAAIRAAAERAGLRCGRHAQHHRNSWSPQLLRDNWGSLNAGVS
ncbi:High-affinity phosphodiesterase [Mycena indigotica]|uniref:High-affinity phosphodiesterase n=1 Tax=Mycena indigotica TaxID=2126181 RepID=A0A8H6WGU6_9AGAR|nr:High-affinity phosphodiesterase [Mycena indigotica]KAF7316276.1 High-affinity phosphodiesterase [Mycena indigotica]